MSNAILPITVLIIATYAFYKKTDAYTAFIKGAKDGLKYTIEILPYILSMIVATSLLRASKILETVFSILPVGTSFLPAEVYALGFFRTLSGSGSLSLLNDIFTEYGVDSFAGVVASVMQGSTDTTLYIITVYLGGAGILKYRHALKLGLLVDLIGFIFAILITTLLFSIFI